MYSFMKWFVAVLVVALAVLGSSPVTQADEGPTADKVAAARQISYRKPDGLILSTGNLYFTSHDASTATVWRTAQSASPGQEILLYSRVLSKS